MQLLGDEGERFEFFKAVQIIQRLHPQSTPVGELGPPNAESIRFSHDEALTFHSSDIARVEPRVVNPQNGHVFTRITTTFLGLYGAASPLANFVSEDVLRAEFNDDHSVKAFYDLFHHRVISLFFRAWKKYRFSAGFRSDASDPFTRRALAFVGIDIAGGLSRHGLPPGDLLPLAPLLSNRTRPPRTLQIVLERLLPDTEVGIDMFVARRVRLDDDARCVLGKRNSALGDSMTIGKSVVDRSGSFRVVVGPVGFHVFEAFAPGGRYHDKLKRVIDQFSGGVLSAELEVLLSEGDSPRFQIGNKRGATLGVTTQLVTERKKPARMRMRFDDVDSKLEAVPDDATENIAAM